MDTQLVNFESLPPELKLRIAEHFDQRTALAVALTHSSWRAVACEAVLHVVDLHLNHPNDDSHNDRVRGVLARLASTPQIALHVREFQMTFSEQDYGQEGVLSADDPDWVLYIRALEQMRAVRILHVPLVQSNPVEVWRDILNLLQRHVLRPRHIVMPGRRVREVLQSDAAFCAAFRAAARAQEDTLCTVAVECYDLDAPDLVFFDQFFAGFACVFGFSLPDRYVVSAVFDPPQSWTRYCDRFESAVRETALRSIPARTMKPKRRKSRRQHHLWFEIGMRAHEFITPAAARFSQVLSAVVPSVTRVIITLIDSPRDPHIDTKQLQIDLTTASSILPVVLPFGPDLRQLDLCSPPTLDETVRLALPQTGAAALAMANDLKQHFPQLRSLFLPKGLLTGPPLDPFDWQPFADG